MLYMQRLSNQG